MKQTSLATRFAYRLVTTLAVLTGVIATASAQFYTQDFESTAIGSKPAEVRAISNFGSGNPATGLTVQNDPTFGSQALVGVSSNPFGVIAIQLPSQLTLGSAAGDSITTTLRFRAAATGSSGFRFGLFNLNGGPSFPTADNNGTPLNGDFGYRTDIDFTANGSVSVGKEFGSIPNTRVASLGPVVYDSHPNDASASTSVGGPDYVQFGFSSQFGAGTTIGTNPYNLTFSMTRTAAGGVTLSSMINGDLVRTATATDTVGNDRPGTTVGGSGDNTGVFNTFDYLAIGLGNQNNTVFLDNVQVNVANAAVVPESGALPLALAGLTLMGGMWVRSRAKK